MKKMLLNGIIAMLVSLCPLLGTLAQPGTVSGKVSSVSGEALPGVNILLKGTSVGTTTNGEGVYQLSSVPSGAVLIFSAIGFVSQEVSAGNQNVLNITLLEDTKLLSEVVVTALGIKREEKSLGFAAQTVDENALKDAKSNNWVNTLSGKVAGLNIQGTGAGPMGSSRITLRGESS